MWYRYANSEDDSHAAVGPRKYLLPIGIVSPDLLDELDGYKICNRTLMGILGLGRRVWGSVCAGVRNSTDISSHTLRGENGNRKKANED